MGESPYDLSSRRYPPRPASTGTAHATVTETAILRGKVKDLEKVAAQQTKLLGDQTEVLKAQAQEIENLRRQVKALRDGAILDEEP